MNMLVSESRSVQSFFEPFNARRLVSFILVAMLTCVTSASGQLIPERLYHGVGQRIVIRVDSPEDFPGELTIKLHHPETYEILHEAPVARGRIDFSGIFPMLWTQKSDQLMLAQLYLDDQASGTPLVLDPMVTPNRATLVEPNTQEVTEDPKGTVIFEDDRLASQFAKGQVESADREIVFSGYRIYIEKQVVLETSHGEIVFRLRPDSASNTAFNFLHLVEGGFYTNIIFHRIVAQLKDGRPFVIQVGDPSGTGSGGPGYMVDLEKATLPHDFGVLSMARAADPDSNGSQIFVCLSREGTSFLDGRYTSFAQAVLGANVIREIAKAPVDENDRPIDPPMILSAHARPSPPIGERAQALSSIKNTAQDSESTDTDEDPGR